MIVLNYHFNDLNTKQKQYVVNFVGLLVALEIIDTQRMQLVPFLNIKFYFFKVIIFWCKLSRNIIIVYTIKKGVREKERKKERERERERERRGKKKKKRKNENRKKQARKPWLIGHVWGRILTRECIEYCAL